jgi:transposase-like protein
MENNAFRASGKEISPRTNRTDVINRKAAAVVVIYQHGFIQSTGPDSRTRTTTSTRTKWSQECKEEILKAHRSGISIHRIAQIFRERNVDISTQHLMRAIRLFIKEGEGSQGKVSERYPGSTFTRRGEENHLFS